MATPASGHSITITPHPKRLRVSANGVVVAETSHALMLKEASYPAVPYIPRADADASLLEPTTRTTHCPFKGDASYFSIKAGDRLLDNAIWSYEKPFPSAADIAGHLAFYPDKVTIEEI